MSRPALEVADIFRDHGAAWRSANAGHVSLDQLKVMSGHRALPHGGARRPCRALRGVLAHRHRLQQLPQSALPQVPGRRRQQWLAEREAELLPVPYFHVVFTLPGPIADIAYQNKAVIYDLLFKAAAETTLTIAADPKHLGATHRHHRRAPHLGLGDDAPSARAHDRAGRRPVGRRQHAGSPAGRTSSCPCACSRACSGGCSSTCSRPHTAGRLAFFGDHAALADRQAFAAFLAPLRKIEWVVYAKDPFGGPEAVLAYLSRYTHRVAISNRRLIAADDDGVTFRWKDYRIEGPAARRR